MKIEAIRQRTPKFQHIAGPWHARLKPAPGVSGPRFAPMCDAPMRGQVEFRKIEISEIACEDCKAALSAKLLQREEEPRRGPSFSVIASDPAIKALVEQGVIERSIGDSLFPRLAVSTIPPDKDGK